MRFIVVDWGTSRFRAYLVDGDAIVDRTASDEGVSALVAGQHPDVFRRRCGTWLDTEPDAPVALVGMVGSREGWVMAPYAACPAGPEEIARAMIAVDLGGGRQGHIVPGMSCEPRPGAVDVMRGEETLALGAGVTDGLVCLPGTHSKWVEMRDGRIARFATFMTGEMYALLRHHSMIGRPATEPADATGFAQGLEAVLAAEDAGRGPGLLHLLFGARAAAVTGRLPPALLGPCLSGLLIGEEVAGALALFGRPAAVTMVADAERTLDYRATLARRDVPVIAVEPTAALLHGLARVLAARD